MRLDKQSSDEYFRDLNIAVKQHLGTCFANKPKYLEVLAFCILTEHYKYPV